jgi:uncharacterized protein (DUF302 family)
MTAVHGEPHTMTRLVIGTGMPFDDFVSAFEEAAPAFDQAPVEALVERGGTWEDIRAEVAKNAPNELMRYAKIDATPLLSVAGHTTKAIEYLVGNHVIAEGMFRFDPKTLLYAPLRMLVYSDDDDNAVFTMDKPSTAFGSLGLAQITTVGEGLDRKVAKLLRIVGVDADEAFAG